MNKKSAFLFGLVCFIAALLATAPATLLGELAYRQSGARLMLARSSGTVWSGNAQLVLLGSSGEDSLTVGQVRWQVFPLQLLLGRLHASLAWNDAPPAWLTLDSSRLHVEHLSIDLPAGAATRFLPAMRAAQLGGQLRLHADSLSFNGRSVQGEARIDWSDASSPLSPVNPLGSYQGRMVGEADGFSIRLGTHAGPLFIDGGGRWSGESGLALQASFKAEPARRSEMLELLRILGNEQQPGSGTYQMQLPGA